MHSLVLPGKENAKFWYSSLSRAKLNSRAISSVLSEFTTGKEMRTTMKMTKSDPMVENQIRRMVELRAMQNASVPGSNQKMS